MSKHDKTISLVFSVVRNNPWLGYAALVSKIVAEAKRRPMRLTMQPGACLQLLVDAGKVERIDLGYNAWQRKSARAIPKTVFVISEKAELEILDRRPQRYRASSFRKDRQ